MKRDFERYFVECQKDYNRLLKQREQIEKEIQEGLVNEEQRNAFEKYYMNVKTNYDRISYMRYLLKLPPKFIQKISQMFINFKIKRELEGELEKYYKDHQADKDNVLKENKESLDKIDRGIEECKNSSMD